jgi:hypothetical protein
MDGAAAAAAASCPRRQSQQCSAVRLSSCCLALYADVVITLFHPLLDPCLAVSEIVQSKQTIVVR